jgi:hypothetical protein
MAGRCRIVLAGHPQGIHRAEPQSAGGFRQWRSLHGRCARYSRNRQTAIHRDRRQHLRFRRLPVGRHQHWPSLWNFCISNSTWRGSRIQRQRHSPEYGAGRRNTTGRNLGVSMPASLAADFANPNAWTMKTLESGEDYNRNTAVTALRFDGHYKFDDSFHLNFGIRNSLRSAE